MNRRTFLRNLGIFAPVLGVALTIFQSQKKKKILLISNEFRRHDGVAVMGYKVGAFLETGYIYAPYIPLYRTPDIT